MSVVVSRETHVALNLPAGVPMTVRHLREFVGAVVEATGDTADLRLIDLDADCNTDTHRLCVTLEDPS